MRLSTIHCRILALASALLLSSCITLGESTDATRYFNLGSVDGPATGHGPGILVGPLELPEYLNRPQLVTRGSGSELQLAAYARWAEPLGDSIARRVASQLRVLLNRQEVHAFPSLGVRQAQRQVVGVIARFEPDAAGAAELHMSWGIQDAANNFSHGPRFSVYRETVDASGGEAAKVAALGRLLDQFAADVAAQVRQLEASP